MKAVVSFVPGGIVSVTIYNVEEGNYAEAATDAALALPPFLFLRVKRVASAARGPKAACKTAKAEYKLSLKALYYLGQLPEERAARLLRDYGGNIKKLEREAFRAYKALTPGFHSHHPIAKFLGGLRKQIFTRLSPEVHEEFHALLRENLRKRGLNRPIGGVNGSRDAWLQHFRNNPGSQRKALDAILETSRAIDQKHGTNIYDAVVANIIEGNYKEFP